MTRYKIEISSEAEEDLEYFKASDKRSLTAKAVSQSHFRASKNLIQIQQYG
ncbi:hypothetical protein [Scytonema sp. NUACC26]|uniref:hypothetical protein n=1 Tax=Scytonema sp. NUACC26 TaxID=3140176 RepID=UPI0034DC5878